MGLGACEAVDADAGAVPQLVGAGRARGARPAVVPEIPALQEGRCKATWKREFKLPWREAGPPSHHDDKVDSDQ